MNVLGVCYLENHQMRFRATALLITLFPDINILSNKEASSSNLY